MEQSGFDDLFTTAAGPAVSNPFADGDNPFADIRSPASDPWASFYAAQPASPAMPAHASPTAHTDSRFASESPQTSPSRPAFSSTKTSEADVTHEEEEEEHMPVPPRSSTLSPPFREVYDEPTVPDVTSPAASDTQSTLETHTPASVYEPSYPTPVTGSSILSEPTPLPTMASLSGLSDSAYDSPLESSTFGNPFAPVTPLTASTSSHFTPTAERKSTADLLDSLGIADDSPSGAFAGPKFKPPPTPKRRPAAKKSAVPKTVAVKQPIHVKEPAPPPPTPAPAPTKVAEAPSPASPAPVLEKAAPVEMPVPASEPVKVEAALKPEPAPPAHLPTIAEPISTGPEISTALQTPLPPSEVSTPAVQTPVRVASPPAAPAPPVIQTIAEPLSPAANTWGHNSALAIPSEPSFLSPLDGPYKRVADRTISDLTLGGVEDTGWNGVASPVTTPGGWLASGDGEILGDRNGQVADVPPEAPEDVPSIQAPPSPRGMKRRIDPNRPSINVTVGDPQKVGDPINAHIVYTVHTTTNSPNLFRKQSFSVLRRYSDFLWLYDNLCLNNPGVIVPPVPEKHSFGRFQDSFVESRRQALNKCIQKIVDHPLLYTDPGLKLFLESDSFALDIKHRKTEAGVDRAAGGTGLMATIGSTLTGPKFIENDDWFENRKMYLDALESQFRGLIKAIEVVAKQRAEVVTAAGELSQALSELATSGLSKQLSHTIGMLSDVESRVKDMQESQAKDDVMTFLAGIDEYTRLIGSIRLAFMSRERVYVAWQNAESDVRKVRAGHEKAKRQGKLPSDTTGVPLAQLSAAERRALDSKNEFDSVTKLVKSEIARFEHERIEDFKDSLELFLENMIRRQRELIVAWEGYQNVLLKRVGANPIVNGSPTSTR